MPLQLPANRDDRAMAIFGLFFSVMVLLPLYCMAAQWRMGEKSVI
jgi:hypothetical protein